MKKIYVAKINGYKKIGRSKDYLKRLGNLQTGSCQDIEIIDTFEVENDVKMENIIHYFLRDYRINKREFFNCSVEHIREVIQMCMELEKKKDNIDDEMIFKQLLTNTFEIGERTDYIKLNTIKAIIHENNLDINIERCKLIIHEIFNGCKFFEKSRINYIQIRRYFNRLKFK